MENNSKNNRLIIVVALAAFFGLAGGIVGELVARTYILDSLFNVPLYGDLTLANGQVRSGLVIRNARQVVVEQSDKVDDTVNAVRGSLVGIFKKQPPAVPSAKTSAAAEEKMFSLKDFYYADSALGQGLILTSDGWLVTNLTALGDRPADSGQYVAVTNDKKVYPLDKIIKDKNSRMVFAHITTRELPVRRFVEPAAVSNGQLVVAANWQGTSWVTTIANKGRLDAGGPISSDSPADHIVLASVLPGEFKGPAVYNLAGDIVGLVAADGRIEPIGHFSGVINTLFKLKAIKRPSLGVWYLPAASLVGMDDKINSSYPEILAGKGALIYKDGKGGAVAKGSPAEAAGIKEGDVILSLDGTDISAGADIATLVSQLDIGDTVTVTIARNGEKKDLEVKIGELK